MTSPEDLKFLRPDYSKDPDFEGYMYLYDAEVIEEEIHLEEMLMKREMTEMQSEVAEKKREAAKEFLKYAEAKFKAEKKEKGVMGIFSEKKKVIQETFSNMVRKVVATGEDAPETSNKDTSVADQTAAFKLVRGESRMLEPGSNFEASGKKLSLRKPSVVGSPQGTPIKRAGYSKEDQTFSFKRRRVRDKRLSVHLDNDLEAIEDRVNFFRREIFCQKFRNLSIRTKKLLKTYYDELIAKRSKYREKMQKKAELGKNLQRDKVKVKGFGPWDLLWEFKYDMIKRESPYNEFPSYMLRQIIVKGGDDLRQEIVAMQLIKLLQSVFQREGASLMLHTYEIVVINSSSGIIGSPI